MADLVQRCYPLTSFLECDHVQFENEFGFIRAMDKRKEQESTQRIIVTRKDDNVMKETFTLLGHNHGRDKKLTWTVFRNNDSKYILLVKYEPCMKCVNCKNYKRCKHHNLSFTALNSLRQAKKRLKPTHSGQIQKSKNVAKLIFDSILWKGNDEMYNECLIKMLTRALSFGRRESILSVYYECLGESFSIPFDCEYKVLIGKKTGFPLAILKKDVVDNMFLFMHEFISSSNPLHEEESYHVQMKKGSLESEWEIHFDCYLYEFVQANGKKEDRWVREGGVTNVECIETLFLLNCLSNNYLDTSEYVNVCLVSEDGDKIEMDTNFIIKRMTSSTSETIFFFYRFFESSADTRWKEKEIDMFFMMESKRHDFMKMVNVTGCWSGVPTSQMLYAIADRKNPRDVYKKLESVCGETAFDICRLDKPDIDEGTEFYEEEPSLLMIPQEQKGFSNNSDVFFLKDGTWEKQNNDDPLDRLREKSLITVREKELSCFNFGRSDDRYGQRERKQMLLIDIGKFLVEVKENGDVMSYLLHKTITSTETLCTRLTTEKANELLASLKRYILSTLEKDSYDVNLQFTLDSRQLLFFLSVCRIKNASKEKVGFFFSDGNELPSKFAYAYPFLGSTICYLIVFDSLLLVGNKIGVQMDKNFCSLCEVKFRKK